MSDYAVIIPIYGQDFYTDMVLEDIQREKDLVDIFLVDNKGDYVPSVEVKAHLKPGQNLGWCRGTNEGWQRAEEDGNYKGYFLMNNDVRLSKGFFWNIINHSTLLDAAVMAPVYNDVWPHQNNDYLGPADKYEPRWTHKEVPFVDGTCMFITNWWTRRIGWLDEVNFGNIGWGADFDYALRIRSAGGYIAVTHMAYLEHAHQGTARTMSDNWEGLAGEEMNTGMTQKYGEKWREILGGL